MPNRWRTGHERYDSEATPGLDLDGCSVVCNLMAVPSFLLGAMLRGLVDREGYTASTHFHSLFDLQLGRVGMTEAQVRATGRKILVAKRPLSRVSRAVEKGETQGFMSSSEAMVGTPRESDVGSGPQPEARATTYREAV